MTVGSHQSKFHWRIILLTQRQMLDVLSYNPLTGNFKWLFTQSPSAVKGSIAGCVCKSHSGISYRLIRIDGILYGAHRLAVLCMKGSFPEHDVDHRDGDGLNNKWLNLRECTKLQNAQNRKLGLNNTSGYLGVSASGNKWQAKIVVNRKPRHLGVFDTPEEAGDAYLAAKQELHQFQPVPRYM
ncbi:MAG TPA: hypothetical protein ENK38_02070 [Gammaproteobacteria bacterium]|nr:hypothetical protein [Gammaproteobacteria bacterium]